MQALALLRRGEDVVELALERAVTPGEGQVDGAAAGVAPGQDEFAAVEDVGQQAGQALARRAGRGR